MSFSPVASGKLTLGRLIEKLHSVFQSFADPRTGKNGRYAIEDAALSAFSVFFMQCPSFLDYQRSMRETGGGSNAQSLFGVHEIPTDNQIRSLLDETAPSVLSPMFADVVDGLQAAGVLQDGSAKQDCELAASKRWLDEGGARYSNWGVTLLGDDLYCHEPFCRQAVALGFHFLSCASPAPMRPLYE